MITITTMNETVAARAVQRDFPVGARKKQCAVNTFGSLLIELRVGEGGCARYSF